MMRQRLVNITASLFVLALCALLYGFVPYYQQFFSPYVVFVGTLVTHWEVLRGFAGFYAAALVVFYLLEAAPRVSKSVLAIRAVARIVSTLHRFRRQDLPRDERVALLGILLKAFFAPLMVVWLFLHMVDMGRMGTALIGQAADPAATGMALFRQNGYWLLLQAILLVDVFFFTIGYLVELPGLKNEIRSVDPTFFGWAVTLACYPPFNQVTTRIFGWKSSEAPLFDHPTVYLLASGALLALMAIYSWASLALNLKASNLTHRGIVDTGPYRFIRHPAYVTKNLAWWIGLQPAVIVAWQTSVVAVLSVVGSMLAWSTLYYLRARTEEHHLRSVDGEYDAYCKRVPYRFIPGVI